MEITTIGLDLAKNVFQVHGIDAAGEVVVKKALRRAQVLPFFSRLKPCLIGIEACGTSHHWARALTACGHQVRLMAAGVCQTICETRQKRCERRRGDLRSGDAPEHAVRGC